jgi:hypothetical protein
MKIRLIQLWETSNKKLFNSEEEAVKYEKTLNKKSALEEAREFYYDTLSTLTINNSYFTELKIKYEAAYKELEERK